MNFARKRYYQRYSAPLPSSAPSRPPLILLVEPDDAIRELLSEALLFHGFKVHVVKPGTSAATITQMRAQGIIVDFGPILSRCSMHFLYELRLARAAPDLAVLLTTTTTWIDPANTAFLRRLKCEVLYQPFELQTLIDWATYKLPTPTSR